MMEWANMQQALTYHAHDGRVADAPGNGVLPQSVLLAIKTDPVFAQLLGRKPSTDPHGGQDLGDGAHPTLGTRWSKPLGRAASDQALTDAERAACGAVAEDAEAEDMSNHKSVWLCGRPLHLSTISADDAWECRLPVGEGGRAPRGPRLGVSIVQVHSVWWVGVTAWARVIWFKNTGKVQPTTEWCLYQPCLTRPTLAPASWLLRRAHLVQHGTALLLNKYFIKYIVAVGSPLSQDGSPLSQDGQIGRAHV